jgi:DNA mismatch repair protein MutS2
LADIQELLKKLDLEPFIGSFTSFFAREKPLFMDGDRSLHLRFIKELSKYQFEPPKPLKNLDEELIKLQKSAILHREFLYEFSKLISYFIRLKKYKFESVLHEWLLAIEIPPKATSFCDFFGLDGEFNYDILPELQSAKQSVEATRKNITRELSRYLHSEKLAPYLVDRQLHYLGKDELLLLRPGFNAVLRGKIVSRSASGFFYVLPSSVDSLKDELEKKISHFEELEYKVCKELSAVLLELWPFLKFLNKQFDRFDHYQARVFFARLNDYEFLENIGGSKLFLKDFYHPALDKKVAKSFSISLDKKVLIVTGVNAGGKTMLLKSILSACLLAKYVIPMHISAIKSSIPSLSTINLILDDPQSVQNNISTFSGRIRAFSSMLNAKPGIIGVDEIELGTDSDEAAALFKIVIEELIGRGFFVVVTTHHKKLASMLASNANVELAAALYDEEKELPRYEFLQGIIGKSYAFETAVKYGIPKYLVDKARVVYGEDKERLSELIDKGYLLQDRLTLELKELDKEKEKIKLAKLRLEEEKEQYQAEWQHKKFALEKSYREAIELAKEAAKKSDAKDIHRSLNAANEKYRDIEQSRTVAHKKESFVVGDFVAFRNMKGVVDAIGKDILLVVDGRKLKIDKKIFFEEARKTQKVKADVKKSAKLTVQKPQNSSIKLDLHGFRVEEALETLDKFISDAILAGFEEILVYHGIGTGRLAAAVREHLKIHPGVAYIDDAPASMGGYGATIIHL